MAALPFLERYGPLHMGARSGEDPHFNCRESRERVRGLPDLCAGAAGVVDVTWMVGWH